MNTKPRFARISVLLLCSLAMFFLAASTRGQTITIQNGSLAIITNGPAISTNITVTGGVNDALVVVLANGKNNVAPPASLSWGGQTISNIVSGFSFGAGRQVTIYSLFNPNPGTHTITATTTDLGTAMQVYTLTNVNTSIAPLVANNYNSSSSSTAAVTVSGVASNSWAVLASLETQSAGTITNLAASVSSGGTVNVQQQSPSALMNATVCMGLATNIVSSDLVSSNVTFTAYGNTTTKVMLLAAVFTPGVAPATFPTIVKQPESLSLYSGGMVSFSVIANGSVPLAYQWLSNSVPLAGATNSTLAYGPGGANVVAGVNYSVVVTNNNGTVTSAAATVSIRTPVEPYETSVANLDPYAFYQFNETANPAGTPGGATAFDNANSLNGIYGGNAENGYNGIVGPTPSAGFPGFTTTNTSVLSANGTVNSTVTIPSLNLNTNSVTITTWIYPTIQFEPLGSGLVFNRDVGSVVGLSYSPVYDINGNAALSYNWNNEPGTYDWISNLEPPQGMWSLVGLVVTPTNATIYMLNANGITSASHNYPHVVQPFSGATMIGGDPSGANEYFTGQIDDVAVFNNALNSSNLYSMFYAATGVTNYAAVVTTPPASQTVYDGQTTTFTVFGGGSSPLAYQWQVDTGTGPTNINNGGQISGANGPILTINNVTNANSGNYSVILSNPWGTANTSGQSASLTVNSAAGPAMNITLSVQQGVGTNWDSPGNWNDGQGGLPASVSAAAYPGSTYELLAGARMRTPTTNADSTFPGVQLTVDGNGVWVNNPGVGSAMGEIRIKPQVYPVNDWAVNFPRLIMKGGQIDNAPDALVSPYASYVEIGGEVDVISNTPVYNDGSQGDNAGLYVTAWLTGSGTFEYHGDTAGSIPFNTLTNNLNIACATNTFKGAWNIVSGILLGSVSGSLGTNTVTIGSAALTNAALETAYNINDTNANLILYGRMFLHQNDTFKSVFINGVPLTSGVYSFATLNSTYPVNFPASWPLQNGSSVNAGSGQITVLANPAPIITTQPQSAFEYTGHPTTQIAFSVAVAGTPPLTYQWFTNGTVALSDNGNRIGSTSNVLTIPNPTTTDIGSYTVVVTNSYGSVTSIVATLSFVAPGYFTSTNISKTTPADWITDLDWQTNSAAPGSGTAASQSGPLTALTAGNNYEIIPNGTPITSGAASITVPFIRTPEISVSGGSTIFPGFSLTVDANTVLMYKAQNGQVDYYPDLVLNGGVLCKALGSASTAVITGAVQVVHQSYLSSGTDSDRVSIPSAVAEVFNIGAALSGSGNLYIMNFLTNAPNIISGGLASQGYSGTWIVQCGSLLGATPGSLGTNSSVIVDTNNTLYQSDMPGVTASTGSALFQVGYSYNTAGTLIITNGGVMNLTTNCAFSAVTINGTSLSSGIHYYTNDLSVNYPNSFMAGGSGSITVQAYNSQWPNTIPSVPHITHIGVSGASLAISATNGSAGGSWLLLQSTNLTLPLSQWQTNRVGTFDGSGNLSTNIVNIATNNLEFYILKVQ